MKPPSHPVPSGDRQMGRFLMAALAETGWEVEVVSTFRTYLDAPNAARFDEVRQAAGVEIERLAANWQASGPPDLWFTYHNHYKAPDFLGADLTARFGLPYAMAEASHAPKRAATWGPWHAAAECATRAADLHFAFTARDREGLEHLATGGTLIDLPPFLDDRGWPRPIERTQSTLPVIATVAMMRPGDKLDSYCFLGTALALLLDEPWHLAVIGDGPARVDVEAALAMLPRERVTFHGALPLAATAQCLSAADVFAWPGFGEAFGLAYLEAQLLGVPVVALRTAGVDSVVLHERTGLLVDVALPAAYADALRSLLKDKPQRRRLGDTARAWVLSERTLGHASNTIGQALRILVARDAETHGS